MNIPIDIRQITYGQYCEFKAYDEQYRSYVIADEATEEEIHASLTGRLTAMTSAVKAIVGDIGDLPIYADSELPADYKLAIGDSLSLQALYLHIVNVINDYVPEAWNQVIVKGQNYYMSARTIENLFKPTVQEAITVLEFNRALAMRSQTDLDGNIAYNMGLRTFAILVRKEGELLPEDRVAVQTFVDKRSKLFSDITMDVCLDVNAFFLKTLSELAQTANIASYLTRRQTYQPQKLNSKQKSELKKSTKFMVGTSSTRK